TYSVTFDASLGNLTTSVDSSSLKGLQSALEVLADIGKGNVQVVQSGNIYRITFVGALAGEALPLIEVHDSGLINGQGDSNTINVNDSGFPSPETAVSTASTLTIDSTELVSATIGGTKPSAGNVISFVFATGINTTETVSYTVKSGDTDSTIAAALA